ncbi:MAG TPA: tetratricopeptide repeat protein, partial [Kofleriaceae bacterium]
PDLARDLRAELSAPKIDRNVADLPAPKLNPRTALADLPAPRAPATALADLPAPRAPAAALADLPAPRGPLIADLPVPRGPLIADLPAPRAHNAGSAPSAELPAKAVFEDLPPPALPRPDDLPAPKGFFDDLALPDPNDLPPPALPRSDGLPAPKGFFDDLPPPALPRSDGLPAPKGFFDDLPQAKGQPTSEAAEVPAPKGFFDDLPGLPHTSKPEAPAPKGFFDGVPGLPRTSKPEAPAPKGHFDDLPGLPRTDRPEVPAPQGFFDDLPGRPNKNAEAPPRGFFDDLPQPTVPSARPGAARDLDLDAGPEIEPASLPPRAASSFDDVDRSRPPGSPVRFDPVRRAPTAPTTRPPDGPLLELEDAPTGYTPRSTPRPVAQRLPTVKPTSEAVPHARGPRRKLVLVILLVVAVLGGGGFVLYRRHVAAVARDAAISDQLASARAAYASNDAQHWQHAASAARRVVDLDDTNREALGIGAESLLASALDDGTSAPAKIAQAHTMLDAARRGKITSPELTRARALAALAAHQPEAALAQLQPLAAQAPQDPTIALYLGWALASKGDGAAAKDAFDRAASAPAVKLAALYGRAGARLALGDLEGAKADFNAVLAGAKDHLGAEVGLAGALPLSAAPQRERDLLAILARKDLATADPRAVAQAWTLAGDAAMRAGRYDVARERFRKALATRPADLAATTGLAETELRDGKLPAAAELTIRAINASKDYFPAQLVESEIEIRLRNLPLATQRLDALARRPTLAPLELARLKLVTGKLREAEGKDDEAADAYVAGAKAAGELDLEPMLTAVGKLAAMAKAADADRDPTRAAALRARAEDLLGGFADRARRDPQLALILGIGYLQAGNADKAEPWLRHAAEARPLDAEARFQHGRALLKSGRPQDALDALNAAVRLDPSRADIAADLAHTYEVLHRDGDAGTLYERLLDGIDPSIELRARGGRFFARTGAIDKAAEQGKKILAVDPRHPAGLYLKGEGLLALGKAFDAKQLFQRAIDADRDPQYLDALGRAAEALAAGGDRDALELALRSYQAALEAAPKMLNSLIGQGRIYVARHEAAKALAPLLDASGIAPKNADVMLLLGTAYQDMEQLGMARQWLEDAARIAQSPEAYWRIGQIERDANHGGRAMAALATATRLATDAEQHAGKPVSWLSDALYLQGRVSLDLRNDAAAREAWSQYVARNPPPSAQLTEVKQLLATSLRR